MKKKSKKLKFIFPVVIVLVILGLFLTPKIFESLTKHFSISSDADFYIVGYHNIEGYQLDDVELKKVSNEKVEIVKGQINPTVKRAELSNRYLVFSEEGKPHGVIGRVTSIDFKAGEIKYHKTNDYAYTSSGSNPDYYFTSASNFLATFDPTLKKLDKYIFEKPVILSDFSNEGNHLYFLGTDVKGDSNHQNLNNLYHFSIHDSKLQLDHKEPLFDQAEVTYYFNDSFVKGNHLYATSSGYRKDSTKEKIILGQLFHYDMDSGTKEFIDLPEIAPNNLFELNSDLVAIEHSIVYSKKIGFSLFHLTNQTSQFIDLSEFGFDINTDHLKDVKQIDDDTLLILVGNKLLRYQISESTVLSKKEVDPHSFHIWLK
ncbi:hypothetical protein [uncultured Granulicatella sp.]|uniref:hypothetical protein n=1 Tax=uncultured Granulicatella sp. TaxID=316089 RepID=UPI0028D268FC|nr:hypothetical protein [uncultured Granulicatella sp.]